MGNFALSERIEILRAQQPRITTLHHAQLGRELWRILRPVHDLSKLDHTKDLIRRALQNVDRSLLEKMFDLQESATFGSSAEQLAELQDQVRLQALNINRPPDGEFALLDKDDYFALTPHTPYINGPTNWRDDQILIHSPAELLELTAEGVAELQNNQVLPGVATAALGLPAAGAASRAFKFALANPDLVDKIRRLGGMEGVDEGSLPPRFLYPVETKAGIRTLLGLMLQNSLGLVNQELRTTVLSILMLNNDLNSGPLVLDRLAKDLADFTPEQREAILLFNQATAPRTYLSDLSNTLDFAPNGHGEFPRSLQEFQIFNFLHESGVNQLFFANADEFLWTINPTLIGLGKRLIDNGYWDVCFLVPNTNNQPGGGAVKNVAQPHVRKLAENTIMSRDMVSSGQNPLGLYTTFSMLSVDRYRALQDKMTQLSNAALEIKAVKGRHGGLELAANLESWAGCEFSDPNGRPDDFKVAFVFAPRPGFFLGIKTLKQSHSTDVPEELSGHPTYGSMPYERYIQHVANAYPDILRGLISGNQRLAEQLFASGFSYLIQSID